ncbi:MULTISPECIES: STAS domain-containing protein [unclassified Streptomyces]|uniref:STAS domain-containing protein n=1 Tax=unclassified Streptomyces TaxID=2593676 RepID=UPI002E3498D4|nr:MULTISPECIES: STAS domain-containing protein [unclassified Streptomyces]WUC67845.1 STAS domain-containing protein [Streptomyces sp. NBC_00539]
MSTRPYEPGPTPQELAAAVTTSRRDGRTTVSVTGEIDIATAPLLAEALRAALCDGVTRVEADLSGVSFCDCSGLNVLLAAERHARTHGRALRVTGVRSPQVRRLFELTGTTTATVGRRRRHPGGRDFA